MRLEEFTDIHTKTLESWFKKNDPLNIFINYYSNPAEWLTLVDGVHRRAYAAIIDGKYPLSKVIRKSRLQHDRLRR